MSVWLTPELEPFYGGTYYPPTSRWGRPGFIDVLTEVARVWREERHRYVPSWLIRPIYRRLVPLPAKPLGDG